jgi:hypothetical protein
MNPCVNIAMTDEIQDELDAQDRAYWEKHYAEEEDIEAEVAADLEGE